LSGLEAINIAVSINVQENFPWKSKFSIWTIHVFCSGTSFSY